MSVESLIAGAGDGISLSFLTISAISSVNFLSFQLTTEETSIGFSLAFSIKSFKPEIHKF